MSTEDAIGTNTELSVAAMTAAKIRGYSFTSIPPIEDFIHKEAKAEAG